MNELAHRATVLAFSGLALIACSSSDDGASSSSSGGLAACAPEGSWEFAPLQGSGDSGTACVALASTATAGATKTTYVFTKNADGSYTQTQPGDATDTPVKLTLDADNCVLSGTEDPVTLDAVQGTDGKTTKATLTGTDKYLFNGNSVTFTGKGAVKADDASVKGFPCNIDLSGTATKK